MTEHETEQMANSDDINTRGEATGLTECEATNERESGNGIGVAPRWLSSTIRFGFSTREWGDQG